MKQATASSSNNHFKFYTIVVVLAVVVLLTALWYQHQLTDMMYKLQNRKQETSSKPEIPSTTEQIVLHKASEQPILESSTKLSESENSKTRDAPATKETEATTTSPTTTIKEPELKEQTSSNQQILDDLFKQVDRLSIFSNLPNRWYHVGTHEIFFQQLSSRTGFLLRDHQSRKEYVLEYWNLNIHKTKQQAVKFGIKELLKQLYPIETQ